MIAKNRQKSQLETANKFFQTLGYTQSDKIFIRFINPVTGKAIKETHDFPLTTMPKKIGFNTYFVVNGQGNTNNDIKNGLALFYEFDDIPKDKQKDIHEKFGLPQPSIQVDTGGKSIHSYYPLSYDIDKLSWHTIQSDLLDYLNADKAIKNISRVMRLPFSDYYNKQGKVTGKCTIIHLEDKKFDYVKLRNLIPHQETEVEKKIERRNHQFHQFKFNNDDENIIDALNFVDADINYHYWLAIGIALFNHFNGNIKGLNIWDNWSSKGNKYKGFSELERKYNSFNGKNYSYTIATLFYHAINSGYKYVRHAITDINYELNKYNKYGVEITKEQWLKNKAKKENLQYQKMSDSYVNYFDIHKSKEQFFQKKDIDKEIDIYYENEKEFQKILELAYEKGYKYVEDVSQCGSGKTHNIANHADDILNIANKEVYRLKNNNIVSPLKSSSVFYVSDSHNNPNNEIIEKEFHNLEPRAKTWKVNNTKKTAMGMPYIHAKSDDSGSLQGNCSMANIFDQAYAKNTMEKLNTPVKVVTGKGKNKTTIWAPNEICGSCSNLLNCRDKGFLYKRLDILGHPIDLMDDEDIYHLEINGQLKKRKSKIRCDISQISKNDDNEQIADNCSVVVIDEIDKEFQRLKEIELSEHQRDKIYSYMLVKYPYLESKFKELHILICKLSEQSKSTRYGLDHLEILRQLRNLDIDYRELWELWHNPYNEVYGKRWHEEIEKSLKNEDIFGNESEKKSINYNIPSNFYGKLLDILCDEDNGVFSMDNKGKLTISQQIDFNFYTPIMTIGLTATPFSKQHTSDFLDIAESFMLRIAKKDNLNYDNMDIEVVTDINGIGSNCHTEKGKEKITNFTKDKQDNQYFSGHKKNKENYKLDNHYWGTDMRGSNLFSEKTDYNLFGLPYNHVGSMKILFRLMDKNFDTELDDNFHNFNQKIMENNIIQDIGRSRANRRPNEKLKGRIFCKELDINFLLNQGYSVTKRDITNTDYVDLMSETQYKKYIINEILITKMIENIKNGILDIPNQKDILNWIAFKVSITQSNLSKLLKGLFNGISNPMMMVKKIFHSLIERYKENGIFCNEKEKDKIDMPKSVETKIEQSIEESNQESIKKKTYVGPDDISKYKSKKFKITDSISYLLDDGTYATGYITGYLSCGFIEVFSDLLGKKIAVPIDELLQT